MNQPPQLEGGSGLPRPCGIGAMNPLCSNQGVRQLSRLCCQIRSGLQHQTQCSMAVTMGVRHHRGSLTACQGFLTPGAFKRSKKSVPSFCFLFSFKEHTEEWATQLPFNTSHLDNSLPSQGACPFHLDSGKKSRNRFRTKEPPPSFFFFFLPLLYFIFF